MYGFAKKITKIIPHFAIYSVSATNGKRPAARKKHISCAKESNFHSDLSNRLPINKLPVAVRKVEGVKSYE